MAVAMEPTAHSGTLNLPPPPAPAREARAVREEPPGEEPFDPEADPNLEWKLRHVPCALLPLVQGGTQSVSCCVAVGVGFPAGYRELMSGSLQGGGHSKVKAGAASDINACLLSIIIRRHSHLLVRDRHI